MPHTARGERWRTLIMAMLAMFLLGAIYAYGVLLPEIAVSFGWENSRATLPQAVLLFVYAVGMGVGGLLQDRTRPRWIVMAGGAAFGLGLILASRAQGLVTLVLSYGVLAGIGFGFAYVASVTAAMKSFTERRGMAAGLVVGAFGLGSVVWAPLAQAHLARLGWQGVLLDFGVLSLILIPLLGLGIHAPWHPHDVPGAHPEMQGNTLGTALRSPLFWTVFAAYMLVTSAGLMWLNLYKVYGLAQGIPAAEAAWLVVITAVGSGTGRILMGSLSDRIGRFPSLIGATIAAMLFFALLAFGMSHLGIFLIAGLIGFAFGTWLALYGPTSTDLFGMRAAGAIYGTLYMSYGLGGLLGPLLGGYLLDRTGSFRPTFSLASGLCLAAIVLFIIATRLQHLAYRHPAALDEEFPI